MKYRAGDIFTKEDWPTYLDSIRRWKPEVILLNDDPILSWVLTERPCDSLFFNTPVVFAGINRLIRDSVMQYPLMTGFGNNINLPRCIEIMNAVTNTQLAYIELDNTPYENALRTKLYGQVSDTTRFINYNLNHIEQLDKEYLDKYYPAKTVISFISCANPLSNGFDNGHRHISGEKILEHALETAKDINHIQVKYDIYSNALMDFNKKPQFTCIRNGFNDPERPKFLGGFFTSTEVQIKDQVDYAVRILKGKSPKALNTTVHLSDYYIDYNAMKMYNPALRYEDFATKYNIVNAPMAVEKPILYYSLIGMAAAFVFVLITIMAQLLYRWRQKGQKELLDDMLYEDKMHDLIFSHSDDTLWSISRKTITFVKEFAARHNMESNSIPLKEFQKMVHPDSISSWNVLSDFLNQEGKKTLRFRLSFDGGETWSWYEMTYTVTPELAYSGKLYGIMLNIDKKKEVENTLAEAQKKASEVALKENFLANISHDLRTPLNAITGFSMLLTNKDMTFEDGEREEYGKIIHQNTEMILKMIDSVMEKAQLETGEIELILKPTSLKDLVQKVYMTNKIIVPSHLQFILDEPDYDFTVNIDSTRTMQVINNFLSNAFKFTAEGSITLGWKKISDDMAEVYVKDTGIGIDEDGQKHIFDRYYKEKENDKGTGLGLNISKTIIEKENGSIGIESKLGKGSKFFFHLPRHLQTIVLLIMIMFGGSFFTSCNKTSKELPVKNILVIHSFSESMPNYILFDECLQSALRANNVNADIRNFYWNMENPSNINQSLIETMFDSLNREQWKPDIILSEGDRVAHEISISQNKELISYIDSLPMVFGALHHPNWNLMREHNNIVVYHDPIDYPTNINLTVELTGKNIINIELDKFHQDSIIKKELAQTIARPPYVDRIGMRPTMDNLDETSNHFKDSIIIFTTSVVTATEDINTDTYLHAWLYPQLSVKYDLYANGIIEKTRTPQFTAIKANFALKNARYLAGYFANYNTVAEDLAYAAAKLLNGTPSKDLSGKKHDKKYYMDYNAMKKLGLNYDDYSEQYNIVNAPLKYRNPLLYYTEYIIIILFAVIIVIIWLALINFHRERYEQLLISDIKRKANLRVLSLNGADSRTLRNEESIKKVLSRIDPTHKENTQLIEQSLRIEGSHQYDIYADLEEDGNYEWWQLRFVVYKTKLNTLRIDGLAININEAKKYEENMLMAIHLSEQAKQKEDFLMTISHEIRTPLNAVVGFSDVVISLPKEMLNQDELDEIGRYISENNTKLAAMIDDILMFSRIESGRLRYVNSEFTVSEIINELYNDWQDKVGKDTQFITTSYHNNIYIYGDKERVKYILNQLISNAIKFTEKGNIVLTANYHYKDSKVEFRVEDSGCGISEEKQTAVFNLFWKDNEFVPGLGLGLNVADKLAEGMNAQLQVDSKEGYGSVFSLIIDATIKRDSPSTELPQQ